MRISDWSSDVCSSDLPALAGEGRGDDLHAEMRLAPLAVAGMTLVLFRIINDLKALRRQGLGQLMLHGLGNGHSPAPSVDAVQSLSAQKVCRPRQPVNARPASEDGPVRCPSSPSLASPSAPRSPAYCWSP